MKDLPEFKPRKQDQVIRIASQVLTRPNQPDVTYFRRLLEYPDGHYGVVFDLGYFATSRLPSKSQWNTLKKRFKRHDRQIFVFKEHTLVSCDVPDQEGVCGCIEFGFFARALSTQQMQT